MNNFDVIRLTPADLDYIFETLLADTCGERSVSWDLLEHLPLPKITLAYDIEKHNGRELKESYEFKWDNDEHTQAFLGVTLELTGGTKQIHFVVCLRPINGAIAYYKTPVFASDVTDKEKAAFFKGYSDKYLHNVDTWLSFPARFLNVNQFLKDMDPEVVLSSSTKATKQSPKSSHRQKKKKSANKVYVYKVYRFKDDWKDLAKEHRHNLMTCPAWGVRGHYRHYKDGKVVWVKAYVKGKDKDKYQNKEYELINHVV